MQKKYQNQAGSSIVEILVALFIIGIVLVLYGASANSVSLNSNARHLEIAQRTAMSEMEDLRAMDITLLPPSGPFTSPTLAALPQGQASIAVTSVNATTYQIAVTVSWYEPSAQSSRSVVFTTLKTQNGL